MPQTILVKTVADLRHHLAPRRAAGQRIGFVPTMGALHAGHLSLVRAARRDCNCVVVSVFVNPTQFVAGEDYHSYPRCLQADLHACQREAVDLLFAPEVSEMYGPEPRTTVHVAGLTEPLCGAHRPGHFDGVTTVVAKLLNIVQPHVAYFGQKDAQQAIVIKRMVTDLNFPLQIVICPTIREPDGLAISSRNKYLSTQQRKDATLIYKSLQKCEEMIKAGIKDTKKMIDEMQKILQHPSIKIEYVSIVDAETLQNLDEAKGRVLVAVAVKIGTARLIDNILIDTSKK